MNFSSIQQQEKNDKKNWLKHKNLSNVLSAHLCIANKRKDQNRKRQKKKKIYTNDTYSYIGAVNIGMQHQISYSQHKQEYIIYFKYRSVT